MFPYLDYYIDPLRNRVVNGTIYADQFYKIFKKIRVHFDCVPVSERYLF